LGERALPVPRGILRQAHLSRQGPPALRWALFEAAQVARRPTSPDRDYYEQASERLGGNRACLAIARKLLKRSYHTPLRARRGGAATRLTNTMRALAPHQLISRGRLPEVSCRHATVLAGLETPSGRTARSGGGGAGRERAGGGRAGGQAERVSHRLLEAP
jgi:hypothetical protein